LEREGLGGSRPVRARNRALPGRQARAYPRATRFSYSPWGMLRPSAYSSAESPPLKGSRPWGAAHSNAGQRIGLGASFVPLA
jgi:hypothetical protein